jgi:glutamine synthetase
MNDSDQKLVADLVSRGITRAKIGGFDIDGVLRGKYVSMDKLRSALSGGFGFCDVIFGWDIGDVLYDSAKVTGWHTGYPDAHAVLDPTTLRTIPWEPGTVAMLADFRDETGAAHPACPRSLFRGIIDRAKSMGFEAKFSCEFEFFLFEETPRSLHAKNFSNLTSLTPGMFGYSWVREGQQAKLMAAILEGMQAFDIEIEGFHTETGPGVFEAAIRYDDALRAADKAALFKVAMKQIAHDHGLAVTFMAKWNAQLPGSSGHLHQSLWRGGECAFLDPARAGQKDAIPEVMRHYIGGQVALMPELTALYAPTINAYKRYVPGVWAPLTASWGVENRTTAIRLIGLGTKSARVEYRQTAADINPYIAMATCLAAGLYGIENKIEPPAEVRGDGSSSAEERRALPRTLAEATQMLAGSKAAREILGEAFVDHYVRTRDWEVRQYERAVTDWELKRYFEAI